MKTWRAAARRAAIIPRISTGLSFANGRLNALQTTLHKRRSTWTLRPDCKRPHEFCLTGVARTRGNPAQSVILIVVAAQLIEHACRDDARGQGDDGDTHERGDHGDGAPDIGRGIQVAVADRREGDDRPVHRVEERAKRVRLDVEDDEGAHEDVGDGETEDGEQGLPLLLKHGGDGRGAPGVANELECPRRPEQAEHSQGAQRVVEGEEDGQYRQEVDDGHGGEGVDDEGQRPLAQLEVGRHPSGEVIEDEHDDAHILDHLKRGITVLEAQGNEAGHDEHGHHATAPHRLPLVAVHQGVETFTHPRHPSSMRTRCPEARDARAEASRRREAWRPAAGKAAIVPIMSTTAPLDGLGMRVPDTTLERSGRHEQRRTVVKKPREGHLTFPSHGNYCRVTLSACLCQLPRSLRP